MQNSKKGISGIRGGVVKCWVKRWLELDDNPLRSEFQAQRNDIQSQLNTATLKISLLEDQVKEFHEVIETYRAVKNITDKTPEKIVTRSFTQFRTMVEKAEHEPSTT